MPRLSQPAQNRSLERGIELLRAFRPGTGLLGNGDLAERTGIAPATVSRLTQTLVRSGMLQYDRRERAYRLAPPVLSMAHAMRLGSPVMQAVTPLMVREARARRINVGLAIADRDDMVYLESVRFSGGDSLRKVVAGQRVPMRLTSLGRAYLAALDPVARDPLMRQFRAQAGTGWPVLERELLEAIDSIERFGFCAASWQRDAVALATPIALPDQPIHVLNMSVSTRQSIASVVEALGGRLLALAERVKLAIAGL